MSTTRISLGQLATFKLADFKSALSETNICYWTFWQKTKSYRNLGGILSCTVSWISQTVFSGNPSAESWWRLMSWSKGSVLILTSWGMKACQDLSLQSPCLLFEHHSLISSGGSGLWRTLTQLVFHFNEIIQDFKMQFSTFASFFGCGWAAGGDNLVWKLPAGLIRISEIRTVKNIIWNLKIKKRNTQWFWRQSWGFKCDWQTQ